MESIAFEIVIIFALIMLNAYLALSEMAIVSSNKVRLQAMANQGKVGARIALALIDAPSDLLASVQVGITLVGVLVGAFGGSTISAKIAHWVDLNLPFLSPWSSGIGLGIVVVVSSYFSLILGELVPKRVALTNPERTAATVARSIRLLSTISRPFVRFLSFSTEWCLRILNLDAINEHQVTEDEVKLLVEQGTEAGIFEQGEETIIKRTLRLGSLSAGDIMTPRTKIECFDVGDTLDSVLSRVMETKHTYFPVYDGQVDNIAGLLSAKHMLHALARDNKNWNIRDCMQEPMMVPESVSLLDVLESFKQKGAHVAIVIDEYGGMAGMLTMIDMMEALVGALPHGPGAQDSKLVRREDGSILLDGITSVHEFEDIFEVDFSSFTEGEDIQTIAGLIMKQMGRIPKEADVILLDHLRIEVVDMDGRRVDKILVYQNQQEAKTVDNDG
ncbi:MAG: hemolysin family protein [Proteobacteria bacterium]|nr:hemolysin family protein [Pseudomonadota bacterium]